MKMVQAMPVAACSPDRGRTRHSGSGEFYHHFVDEGRSRKDMSAVTQLGIDETCQPTWPELHHPVHGHGLPDPPVRHRGLASGHRQGLQGRSDRPQRQGRGHRGGLYRHAPGRHQRAPSSLPQRPPENRPVPLHEDGHRGRGPGPADRIQGSPGTSSAPATAGSWTTRTSPAGSVRGSRT